MPDSLPGMSARRRNRRAAAHRLPDLPRQAARRRPGRLHPPPHQGARRPRPPRRGVQRPAVPGARRAGRAHQAAQPRHLQRPLPRSLPGLLGDQDPRGPARARAVLDRHVLRAAGVQLPRPAGAQARGPASSTSSTTTSASATGSSQLEKLIPTIVTLHHPITRDRELEMEHAPTRRKRLVGRAVVLVREDAGPRRHADAAHRRRQRELDQRHPHRHGRRPRPDAARAGGRRSGPVPPAAGCRPRPRPADHDGIGRRGPEGALVPARGDGQAAHRARRHADHHRQAEGRPQHGPDRRPRPPPPRRVRVRASPTSESSSCTPRPSWPWCPASTRGSACRRSRRWCTGTALVATDGGALPEVTGRDGDTVLPAGPGTPTALAAAIGRGLDDPELRARVGADGRQRVLDRWTWRRCAELTVEQYREVLAMPANVAKLAPQRPDLTARPPAIVDHPLRPARRSAAPGALVLDVGPASAGTPSSSPAAGHRVVALDYADDEVRRHPRHVRRDGLLAAQFLFAFGLTFDVRCSVCRVGGSTQPGRRPANRTTNLNTNRAVRTEKREA